MTFWPVFVSWRFISSWTLSDSQGLSNCTHVEGLQERTQCALEDYIRTQYPNQPTRFGKLLLRLPSLRLIRPGTVEALFFPPINLAGTVESALNEMLVITSVVTSSSNNWANAGFPNGNIISMNANGTTVMWLVACGISTREMFTMRRYKYGKLPPCDARLIYVEDVSIENCAVRSKKLGLHRRFVFHRASEEWL